MSYRIVFILSVLSATAFLGQSTPGGKATASGTCSVAHSGNKDVITINCGIGKEQGDKIIELLNAALADGDQNRKLDELLALAKRSDPYGKVVTYEPNGTKRTSVTSTGAMEMDQSATVDFNAIFQKKKARDWQGEIDLSQKAIAKYPDWYTPLFTLAEGQLGICDKRAAYDSFVRFRKETEGAVAYEEFRDLASQGLVKLESFQYTSSCRAYTVYPKTAAPK